MGQPSNSRYQTVWWLARRTDVTFGLPEQVCAKRWPSTTWTSRPPQLMAVPVLVQLVEDTAVDALASNSGPTANPGDGVCPMKLGKRQSYLLHTQQRTPVLHRKVVGSTDIV